MELHGVPCFAHYIVQSFNNYRNQTRNYEQSKHFSSPKYQTDPFLGYVLYKCITSAIFIIAHIHQQIDKRCSYVGCDALPTTLFSHLTIIEISLEAVNYQNIYLHQTVPFLGYVLYKCITSAKFIIVNIHQQVDRRWSYMGCNALPDTFLNNLTIESYITV